MSKINEILELTRIRILLFLREPEAIFWVFFFPLVLAAVLGFAFRKTEVEPSRVGMLAGESAEEMMRSLEGAENLQLELVATLDAAEMMLRKGTLDGLIEPTDPPSLRFDPNRPEAEITRLRLLRALDGSRGDEVDAQLRLEPKAEIGSRYIDFLFPGLLGMNLMGTGMWTIGFAVADMRQRKVLKRLLVTPMNRASFLFSFLLSRLVYLVLEIVALVGFAMWVLDVPQRSNFLGFGLLCLLGAFVFSGLGLLAVSRTRTIQGASGIINFMMMPLWLFSGVFFSYERFPEAFHPLCAALPLSALNDGLRAMMLDGQSLWAVAPQLLILAIWGLLAFFVALKIFRWE